MQTPTDRGQPCLTPACAHYSRMQRCNVSAIAIYLVGPDHANIPFLHNTTDLWDVFHRCGCDMLCMHSTLSLLEAVQTRAHLAQLCQNCCQNGGLLALEAQYAINRDNLNEVWATTSLLRHIEISVRPGNCGRVP
jgi:hypothetical protein